MTITKPLTLAAAAVAAALTLGACAAQPTTGTFNPPNDETTHYDVEGEAVAIGGFTRADAARAWSGFTAAERTNVCAWYDQGLVVRALVEAGYPYNDAKVTEDYLSGVCS